MDLKTVFTIDLAEFGGDGLMEMGNPSFRRMNEIKNEATRRARIDPNTNTMDRVPQGDLEILSVLMYVRKAPFTCTIEGWLRYCDILEEKDPLASYALFERMKDVMNQFEELKRSPFVPSQAQETPSSD